MPDQITAPRPRGDHTASGELVVDDDAGARVVDVRLVRDREGRVHVRVEGRIVAIPPTPDPAIALALLARRVDAAAWAAGRSTSEELGDPASTLYSGAQRHDDGAAHATRDVERTSDEELG
jgi:hypothetical protein